jgi:hypothetical protein
MQDRVYYSTKELAQLIGMSEKFVVEHRHKIFGAHRLGRFWRFDKAAIDMRIAAGKDIIAKT